MVEVGLIVSAFLQWLVLIALGSLVLTLMHFVGKSRTEVMPIEASELNSGLKGQNISEELVLLFPSQETVQLGELLNDHSSLMILTDPSCQKCDTAMKNVIAEERFPVESSIIVVRGTDDAAALLASMLPAGCRVISERRGLGLSSYAAPLATVLDSSGSFMAVTPLEDLTKLNFIYGVLEGERAIERMRDGIELKVQSSSSLQMKSSEVSQ